MEFIISQKNSDDILDLRSEDYDKAMDLVYKTLEIYIKKYNKKEECDIDKPVFLEDTKNVFTMIYNFYNDPELIEEMEEEMRTTTCETEKEEIKIFGDFINDLQIVKDFVHSNNYSIETLKEYEHILTKISNFICEKTREINELNNCMSSLNDSLGQLASALDNMVNITNDSMIENVEPNLLTNQKFNSHTSQ